MKWSVGRLTKHERGLVLFLAYRIGRSIAFKDRLDLSVLAQQRLQNPRVEMVWMGFLIAINQYVHGFMVG